MKMKLLITAMIIGNLLKAQEISVGIFNTVSVKKVFIESKTGKYKVKSGNKRLYTLKGGRSLILKATKLGANVRNSKKDYGIHDEITLIGKKGIFKRKKTTISLKLLTPKQKTRQYSGDLDILYKNKKLKLINKPPFQDYLAGVVEAESGTRAEPEYYKCQAIICRTYALKEWNKHKKDGFNLCDGVHCQAYKGIASANKDIRKAVSKTNGLVILDKDGQLISALFSANCGGQTNNSEDVWSTQVSYLRSRKDTYCTDQRQAHWEKTINLQDFKTLLKKNNIDLPAKMPIDSFAFKQANRLKHYTINQQQIKLTTIRYALHLRSTFFEIEPMNNRLLFHGRGYGHGVGMCQEGAMNMAKKGKRYDDIIKYYYKDVKIRPVRTIKEN